MKYAFIELTWGIIFVFLALKLKDKWCWLISGFAFVCALIIVINEILK